MEIDGFSPVGITVLIDPDPPELELESGLVLPETVNPYEGGRGQTGTVLKVGPRYNEESGDDLVPGDRVVFMPLGIKTIPMDNKEYVLATSVSHPRTILAKLT